MPVPEPPSLTLPEVGSLHGEDRDRTSKNSR